MENQKHLQMKHPIIQAPMAGGITTNELIIAVTEAGGLGMIGAGYMSTAAIIKQVDTLHKKGINYFGINLFVPQPFTIKQADVNRAITKLNEYFPKACLDANIAIPNFEQIESQFHEQIETVINKSIPICSFTFGIPNRDIIKKLKDANTLLMATATTLEEAKLIEAAGFDYIVLQGSEAGGHRGSFTKAAPKQGVDLIGLMNATKTEVTLPWIASGGIMNKEQMEMALHAGASAVQMGTAFLTCHESGAHPLYKMAITKSRPTDLTITRSFSGKWAQGINNQFIEKTREIEASFPSFPVQNTLTQGIRKIAANENDATHMSLWAGQNLQLAKQQSVMELMQELTKA